MLLGNKSCTVGMPFYYSLNGVACLGCTHEELCQCQTTINSCFELLVRQVWTIWCLISRAWTWSVNMFDWSGWDPCHRATSSWCFARLSFSNFWVSPSAISKLKARSHMRVDIRDRLWSRCPNKTTSQTHCQCSTQSSTDLQSKFGGQYFLWFCTQTTWNRLHKVC